MARLVPIVSALAVFLAGCATHHAAPPPVQETYREVTPVQEQAPAPAPPPAAVVEPAPAPAPAPKPAPPKVRKSSGGAAALKENQW